MWRTQSGPALIDLSNNFFIVKLYMREEYERSLMDGPGMIRENYLQDLRWRPNFRAEKAEINSLPLWVRFLVLPVEYYSKRWLKKAGNHIGQTVKLDITRLLAPQGKFARVCVEVDF